VVDQDQSQLKGLLFLQVISMFQAAAMQQLGKIVDPLSGEVTRDLEQAKMSIDILEVLKAKTSGNLDQREAEFVDKVLFELHMNYVDELKTRSAGEAEEAEGDKEKAEGAMAEDPPDSEAAPNGESDDKSLD